MNLNDIYNSIASFWDSISPIFFAHLIAFLSIRWIAGFRLHILSRAESYISSDRYKERWKPVLDEFELRPKLPYILLVAFFIYLSVFNSVFLNIMNFPPLEIIYSETEFWEESRPVRDITKIAEYGKNPEISFWEIYQLKQNLLQDYQVKYADQYRALVNWLGENSGKWLTYYKCSILFFLLIIFFAIRHLRDKNNRSARSFMRIFALLIFALLAIGFTRYKAESYIEKRLIAELTFVASQLPFDEQAQKNRLSDTEIAKIKERFCAQPFDQSNLRLFWWSRTLENLHLATRPFTANRLYNNCETYRSNY